MPLLHRAAAPGLVSLMWRLSAGPEAVWRHLTDMGRLPEWLGRREAGAFVVGDDLVIDHGDGHLCRSTVQVAERGRALDMTWHFSDEPPSRVTFTLDTAASEGPPDEASNLRLEHTGLGDLARSYLPGWITHLTYFEASLHGIPIPSSAFWRLYETHDRLLARTS